MIKKIEYIDTPFIGKDTSKLIQFTNDIKEVIANRIEYAELINFPYADSTANADLAYKARKICREYVWDTYGRAPIATDFFKFAKRNREDGLHWYIKFNTEAFEKMVDEFELS